jgi:hypothetical protein
MYVAFLMSQIASFGYKSLFNVEKLHILIHLLIVT